MSDTKHLIELLQGIEAGRKWGIRFKSTGDLVEQSDQSIAGLHRCALANDVERVELMPLPDEITLPARVIPAPLREAPKNRTTVYFADPFLKDFVGSEKWEGSTLQQMWLARGLLHLLKANAIQASKAMCPYA